MIVVDTNVIAYLWIPGDWTTTAERLLRDDPEWCAPLVWRSELRNVLVGYLRRGWLDLATTQRIADQAESHLAGHEYTVASASVLARAAASRCSAYEGFR